MKKWIIVIAVALVIFGAVICGAAAAAMHFDFNRLDNGQYETNTYDVKDRFSSITFDVDTGKIFLEPSNNGKCRVVCFENKDEKHDVYVKNGTLTIKRIEDDKLNSFGLYNRSPEITVYLPESSYEDLMIKTDTGDIKIPAGFAFESISVDGDTSDVECGASVEDLLKIHVSTGDITVENIKAGEMDLKASTGHMSVSSVRCDGDISAAVSTGKIKLQDITCTNLTSQGSTGDITLKNVVASGSFNITRNTGDVEFDGSDAATITVKTTTGDVKGTFLTEKIVFAETDTGKVKVPKSVSGGRCEISTDTGDIEISMK